MAKIFLVAFSGVVIGTVSILSVYVNNYFREVVDRYPENVTNRYDFGLSLYNLVSKAGYNAELHHVVTDDGYVLGIHHLNKETNEGTSLDRSRPVVLLVHCLLGSSWVFLNQGPDKSLGLMLANKNWDVWLGNNRGNKYSRKHLTLDPDRDAEFWDFSFEECGVFDMAAMIDYVRNRTQRDKIFVIGYSQGNTQFFSLVDSRPEYNDKVAMFVALGPCAYLTHMTSPGLLFVTKAFLPFLEIASLFGFHEIFPNGYLITSLLTSVCGLQGEMCRAAAYYVLGFEPSLHEKDTILHMVQQMPEGVSLRMFKHYNQLIGIEKFQKYDYGPTENLRRYNSTEPPSFNLSAMSAPITLVYSEGDTITTITDVERLADQLPNVVKKLLVNLPIGHMDFVWCKDIDKIFYLDLINYLEEFYENSHETSDSMELQSKIDWNHSES